MLEGLPQPGKATKEKKKHVNGTQLPCFLQQVSGLKLRLLVLETGLKLMIFCYDLFLLESLDIGSQSPDEDTLLEF